MTFYRDINKFYDCKLIINSKYNLIVVSILLSFHRDQDNNNLITSKSHRLVSRLDILDNIRYKEEQLFNEE